MRLLSSSLLALFSLPLALATTTQSPHAQLVSLAQANNGLIRLDTQLFELITSPGRNWSAAVQFTALDSRRRCSPCREFDPSWNAVAKSWAKVSKDQRDQHFFATVEFDDAMTVFQQLGLSSAPVVYVYPPTEGPRQSSRPGPIKYDFSSGFDAGPLAESLSHHTPIPIPYTAPFDYMRWVTVICGLLGLALTLRFISPILQNRWTWAFLTVSTSLVMTSGYMFTRIRNVPYSGGNGNWVASGYQNMFGQEVQVVAVIYGILAFSFIMQIVAIPYQTSAGRQKVQVYLWSGVILLIYSVLVALFKVKNRGYPFKLLL